MSTNPQRAEWAASCVEQFMDLTGADTLEDAIGDLIANLGHFAQSQHLDFLRLVRTGIAHWHLEQTDPDSIDVLPAVGISIKGRQVQ